jgi:hypothetical protein
MRTQTASSSSKARSFNGKPHPKAKATARPIHEELRAQAAQFEDDFEHSSTRRVLMAWITGLGAACASAYGWNLAIDFVTVAAFSITGSSFLAMAIYVIGLLIAIYSSVVAFSSAFAYVVSSKPEQHYALVKGGVLSMTAKVRGMFSRSESEVIIGEGKVYGGAA